MKPCPSITFDPRAAEKLRVQTIQKHVATMRAQLVERDTSPQLWREFVRLFRGGQ